MTARKKKTPAKKSTVKSQQKRQKAKNSAASVVSTVSLLSHTLSIMKSNIKPLSWLAFWYVLFQTVLIRTTNYVSVVEIEASAVAQFGSSLATLPITAGVALSVGTVGDPSTSLYSLILFVLYSLAIIWTARRLIARQDFAYRDAFYKSTYPLIPFVLIMGVVVLQILPFMIGAFLFSAVSFGSVSASFLEQLPFGLIWFGLGLLSSYLLAVSIPALYAVTLPDMNPMQALRAVRRVVDGRRWFVAARIISVVFVAIMIFTVLFLVIVAVAPKLTFLGADILFAILLPFVHIYLFSLYRELVQ